MTEHEARIGAAHRAGVTYRRLDYWTRCGYLHPDNDGCGQGVWREWTEHELEVARIMGKLTRAGLTLGLAAEIARRAVVEGGTATMLAPGVTLYVDATAP